jgi:hypothetical protein
MTNPTRISGSPAAVETGTGVRRSDRTDGTEPDTQLASSASRMSGLAAIVAKLELDPEILRFEEGDHRL